MDFLYLDSAEHTDTGRKRKRNEDAVLRLPERGVFCVADGMGGARCGDVASQAIVDVLRKKFSPFSAVGTSYSFRGVVKATRDALDEASRWIKDRADEIGVTGTGATTVAIAFDRSQPSRAIIVHAGDSRAYRIRRHHITQLTTDHSVAAAAGLSDQRALPAMFRGVVTRAVGLSRNVDLDETRVDVEPADVYLLCSDGLTNMVPDKTILRMVARDATGDLDALAQDLVKAANRAGGEDNITVLLVRVARELPPATDDTTERPTRHSTAEDDADTAPTLPGTATPALPADSNEPGSSPDLEDLSGATPTQDPDMEHPALPLQDGAGDDRGSDAARQGFWTRMLTGLMFLTPLLGHPVSDRQPQPCPRSAALSAAPAAGRSILETRIHGQQE